MRSSAFHSRGHCKHTEFWSKQYTVSRNGRHRQVQGINRADRLPDLRQRSDFQKSEETALCQIANLLRIAIYDHPYAIFKSGQFSEEAGVKGTTEQHKMQANLKCKIQMQNQLGLFTSQKKRKIIRPNCLCKCT